MNESRWSKGYDIVGCRCGRDDAVLLVEDIMTQGQEGKECRLVKWVLSDTLVPESGHTAS